MQKPAHLRRASAFTGTRAKPKLKEAAQAALIGVELDEGEDRLVIAGGFDLKAERCGAQVGGDGKPGFFGLRFDGQALGGAYKGFKRAVPVFWFLVKLLFHFGKLSGWPLALMALFSVERKRVRTGVMGPPAKPV